MDFIDPPVDFTALAKSLGLEAIKGDRSRAVEVGIVIGLQPARREADRSRGEQFGELIARHRESVGWAKERSDVPTIYHPARCEMVGTLRFAHPTSYSAAAACLHPITRRRMPLRQPRTPRAEQLLPQRPLRILALVPPAPGQLRHQHVRDILEIAGRGGKRNVEPVDIGLLEPRLDIVGDFFGRADHDRPGAADADMLDDFAHGPHPVRIGARDVVERGAPGVVLDMAHFLVEVVAGEVDAHPARHQRQRALGRDVAAIVGVFRFRLRFGAAENDRHHREHQNLGRVAPDLLGLRADRGDARPDDFRRRSRHEHAFGMLGGKLPSARRGAGLVQHRRPLRRRLAEMDGVEPVVVSLMLDAMHF